MDSSLLIAAGASFIAGLLGYIIAMLWIKPIARYHITKRKLGHALTQCLVKMNATAGSGEKSDKGRPVDILFKNARKQAMGLVSCYDGEIPYWYRLLLDSRRESPTEVSGLLTNLSKIRDREQVIRRIKRAQKTLGLQ